MGATGWVCSEARRRTQAKQYPEYASNILGVCAKWDGKQCYDCAQLVRAAAAAVGVKLPSGATSQWNSSSWAEKGTIDTMPDERGIILFKWRDGRMQHVEVYTGDGMSCGARNSAVGVKKFPMSGYSWTHWARLKEPEPERRALVKAEKGSTVNLRQSCSTKSKLVCRVPIGSTVTIEDSCDVDGWMGVSFCGKHGYMMSEFLEVISK